MPASAGSRRRLMKIYNRVLPPRGDWSVESQSRARLGEDPRGLGGLVWRHKPSGLTVAIEPRMLEPGESPGQACEEDRDAMEAAVDQAVADVLPAYWDLVRGPSWAGMFDVGDQPTRYVRATEWVRPWGAKGVRVPAHRLPLIQSPGAPLWARHSCWTVVPAPAAAPEEDLPL